MEISLDVVKQKTMELLETSDPKDVEYITQEMIESDLKLTDDDEISKEEVEVTTAYYGHNMRYSNRRINGRNYQVYVVDNGGNWTSPSSGCGNSHTGWLRQDLYNYTVIGNCSSRDAKLKFTRR